MRKMSAIFTGALLFIFIAGQVFGQQALVSDANKKQLAGLSVQLNNRHQLNRQKALELAKIKGWPLFQKTKNGGVISLQGVNSMGFPVYQATYENIIAAATTNTNAVQPGGSLGLNLSGSGANLNDKLAIWDGGSVYKAHQEFAGKIITIFDGAPVIDHATHVAGTMIAKGVYPPAKGMAYNATTLHSYFFDNDIAEMSSAASGLLISNHSYGDNAGWFYDESRNIWEWLGLPGDTEDYNFGFYDQNTQAYDNIAYNAPYYLIVKAAGNFRTSTGPPVGADYYGFKSRTDGTIVDKGPRPPGISSNNSYDIITTTGNAKNILTVGAVNPIRNGPQSSLDISIAPFSSWGPTDDGRIKPDIVGDGVSVLSTGAANPTTYISLSGTSMASPNVSGSLYLLQEYYAQKNGGNFMRSATLKGLACHTAFDAGNAGPDYIYGWGLLNTKQAAQAITNNGGESLIKEKTLQQGQPETITVVASGAEPLSATISWTDPAGTPTPEGILNSHTPKLVNDLDIRVSDGTTTFYPWILDPPDPSSPARTGDNVLDNIEQVFIPGAVFGKTYTITISHKGTLRSGSQDYSLIVTGIGANTYCDSGPLSSADSRINNVTLSNINNTPPAGCTTYSDYTNLTAQLQQGVSYPLSISLGTCNGNFNKAAKVYIDWNVDGVFEANELVATTGIINATGTYTTNITVPVTVVPGSFALMRVVCEETNDASVIQSCGSYAKGETQDYKVQFAVKAAPPVPTITAGMVSGDIKACAGTASVSPFIQQVTVSGANLTGNITAIAPTGFEISLNAASGFGNGLVLPVTRSSVNNTVIYVRSSATAPPGHIAGNLVVSSPAATQNILVTGQVNAVAVVNQVAAQGPYTAGAVTQPVVFTGTAQALKWVNDTPGIGLAASGSSNIPSFTTVNTTNHPITATITVTPLPSPGFAYIPNSGSNTVSVLNTGTDAVVATVTVGNGPYPTCVSPDGSKVYVGNIQSNNVSVIDVATNSVINTILLAAQPTGLTLSPDGSKLYVSNDVNVSVINTATNENIQDINVGQYPYALLVSPDGNKLYATNSYDSVYVINLATGNREASILVDQAPWRLLLSPDGSRLYVANTFGPNVSVINTATNKVINKLTFGVGPMGIAFSPDGSRLYVDNSGDQSYGGLPPGTVSVVNTADFSVIKTVNVGLYPVGLSVTADGSKVFVPNDNGAGNHGSVSIINTATNTVENTVQLGTNPASFGNFITNSSQCTGPPMKFTITVNPPPTVLVGNVSGNISACSGSPSANPNIEQFTVSGIYLTGNIAVNAPTGFEVSTSANSGYASSVSLAPEAGAINSTIIYVRSSASASVGNISGMVELITEGASDQTLAVSGTIVLHNAPSVTITTPSQVFCAGVAAVFTAAPVNGGSAPVYQWQLNGNNVGTNSPTFTLNSFNNGDVVSCTMTSNSTCAVPANAVSNNITLTVAPVLPLSVNIAASGNNICSGTPVTFTATGTNGGSTPEYRWLLNGNNAGTNSATFVSNMLANGDVVSCMLTNPTACGPPVTSNSVTMVVNPSPVVSAGGNQTIKVGASVTLNGTATGNITDITWAPATGLSNNKILTPVASPSATTTYTLMVQTTDGCTGMDKATVQVLQPFTIPNAFTPNGDGVNDKWDIKFLDAYTNCTVKVFTRWGQNVYSSIGYNIPWDGTYRGSRLPSGTYYYVIDLKNNSKVFSGYVEILK